MLQIVKNRFSELLAPGLAILFVVLQAFSMQVFADAKQGSEIFESKCAGCHSIGKGTMVGPDLAKGKSWTEDNLESSIKRMENTVGALSSEEVNSLMDYLKNPETVTTEGSAGSSEKTGAALASEAKSGAAALEILQETAEIAVGSSEEGAQLFDGRRAFAKGGMACNACHSVDGSGSTMGPDLKNISSKMNNAALLVACQQTPFKVMKTAYADHPVSKQEALSLVKYLESVKDQKTAGKGISVMMAGTCGSIFVLVLVAFGYRNRNTSVRKKLQRRQ